MVHTTLSSISGSCTRGVVGHAFPVTQQRAQSRRRKRANGPCRASNDSEPESSPASLDWRKFRAGLIAQEKREQQGVGPQGPGQADSRAGGEASTSAARAGDEDVWAHLISAPEPGCLMLAKKSAGDMGFFNNSVVLLLQHSNSAGSLGLILGRHLKRRLQKSPAPAVAAGTATYLGGPVALYRSLVLHGPPAVEESTELLQGVYICGWEGRGQELAAGEGGPEQQHISVFSGSCGWSPWQLEQEERTGAWWMVAASPQLVHAFLQERQSEAAIKRKLCELADIREEEDGLLGNL